MTTGVPPSRPGSGPPTTGSLRIVPRLPLSVRLIGRSSVPGAIIVLAVAAVLTLGVPGLAAYLDRGVDDSNAPLAVAPTVDVSLAPGWSLQQGSRPTTLVDGSATMTLETAMAPDGALEALIDEQLERLAQDATATWIVTEPSGITTDAGDAGATITATNETSTQQTWVVDHGAYATIAVLTAPTERWAQVQPDGDQMVRSLTLDDGADGAGDADGGP